MNGNVVIKSFPNGISVKLSDEPDFEKILQDTKNSFEKTDFILWLSEKHQTNDNSQTSHIT